MSRLSKLYQAMETLASEGLELSVEQEAQLRKAEEEIIQKEILPVLTEKIEPVLNQIERELVLVVDYIPKQPLKVSLSRKRNIAEVLTDAVEISPKGTRVVTAKDIKRSPSIDFTVTFDDGNKYAGNGKDTFIDALKHMLLPRVATFDGRTFAGFPLVGRKQRVTEDGYHWQTNVDGWWIYTNMGNDIKINVLKQVADFLGINIQIESSTPIKIDKPETKEKGKRTMFSLNGSAPLNKRNAVYATVKKFIEQNPDSTFEDVEAFFPRELQGSYGVVASEEEYQHRKSKGQDTDRRYFIDKPFTDPKGRKFYVCHQWGDNFAAFQKHVAETLGWTLEEIK